jgi:hypothetical protein
MRRAWTSAAVLGESCVNGRVDEEAGEIRRLVSQLIGVGGGPMRLKGAVQS